MQQLEAELGTPEVYGDKNRFRTAEEAYKQAGAALAKANEEYETVFEKVMELEAKVQG